MVRRTKHVVDRNSVLGEREQHDAIEDAYAAKRRHALDHQATRATTTRARCDKSTPASVSVGQSAIPRLIPTVRKCESSIGDSTVIRTQFTPSSPRIQGFDFVTAREAPAIRYLSPMTQHPPDQPPLLHPLGPL